MPVVVSLLAEGVNPNFYDEVSGWLRRGWRNGPGNGGRTCSVPLTRPNVVSFARLVGWQSGWTPLLRAVSNGHDVVVDKLLECRHPSSVSWANKVWDV